MGTVTFLSEHRRASGQATAAEVPSVPPAAAHIQQALARYRRDLGLMLGREEPSPADVDDVVILEQFRASRARRRFIGDRIVRIKTLEAMLEMLSEGSEAVICLESPLRGKKHT